MPMGLAHSTVKTPFFTADIHVTEPGDRGSAPSGLSRTLDPSVSGQASLRTSESTARIYIPLADKEGRMEEAKRGSCLQTSIQESEAAL